MAVRADPAEGGRLERIVRSSPALAPVLDRWLEICLPDAWLVAGAIAQSVWNSAFGYEPLHGLADLDLVYFDGADLSEESEARQASRVQQLFASLPLRLDVKNEARVHLWYEAKFGYPIRPYGSAADAIATFPTTATAVGLRPSNKALQTCAPFGLADLLGLVVRPNKTQITRSIYEAKIDRWRRLWPGLSVIDW
jgi:hypothetical protein